MAVSLSNATAERHVHWTFVEGILYNLRHTFFTIVYSLCFTKCIENLPMYHLMTISLLLINVIVLAIRGHGKYRGVPVPFN